MSSSLATLFVFVFALLLLTQNAISIDYGAALTKSLLYFEAQRSGKLPRNQRVQWRGDSALTDGKDAGVDLVGGYYDAGDNVKFGFPMAFTVTMLAWSVVEFGQKLEAKNELRNALDSIKWGTDYFIKAHPHPNVLYGEVGEGNSDHQCWQRPEDMTTPRSVYKIDEQHPGSDLAAETAAAFAAASIAFRPSKPAYSYKLISHAKQLFDFAVKHPGQYQNSIPVAGQFYSSSGYQDELLWAAAWLLRATNDETYANYITSDTSGLGGVRHMFSWDDKFAGLQVLVAKNLVEGKFGKDETLHQYKLYTHEFICNCIQRGQSNVQKTKGGLLWWQPWNNLQYTTSALFIITAYADLLMATNDTLHCFDDGSVHPQEMIQFVQSQVNNMLGANSKRMSYMVGFGTNYPRRVHHRGASIVSIKKDRAPVECKEGFVKWFNNNEPNPNVIEGAIVGGPDLNDAYSDTRGNFQQAEAATANTAPLVGVLARLAT